MGLPALVGNDDTESSPFVDARRDVNFSNWSHQQSREADLVSVEYTGTNPVVKEVREVINLFHERSKTGERSCDVITSRGRTYKVELVEKNKSTGEWVLGDAGRKRYIVCSFCPEGKNSIRGGSSYSFTLLAGEEPYPAVVTSCLWGIHHFSRHPDKLEELVQHDLVRQVFDPAYTATESSTSS